MRMSDIRLAAMTLAATDVAGMVAFYNAVFGCELVAKPAFGTTLYEGQLAGIKLVVCPNEVAGVNAEQNRHQLRFEVAGLAGMVARVLAAGGALKGEAGETADQRWAAVVDPDGNTIELVEAAPGRA
jgi:predicted enzyme related to lactoylglutathione lyase